MSTIPSLLKLKDYVTLIGTTCGMVALFCAAIGAREFISLGFFLISISVGTDLLDGYIARKTGTVNEIGKELDSLSDSLTFGIAPAALTFQAFRTGTFFDFILAFGAVLFALGAILRLARFNISENAGYTGVPTPLSGLALIVFFFANYFYAYALGGPGTSGLRYPFPMISIIAIPFIMMLIGWFNITTFISFGEKDKLVYIIFIIFAPLSPIFGILGIIIQDFPPETCFTVAIIASIFFLCLFIVEMVYIFSGFVKHVKKKKAPEKA